MSVQHTDPLDEPLTLKEEFGPDFDDEAAWGDDDRTSALDRAIHGTSW